MSYNNSLSSEEWCTGAFARGMSVNSSDSGSADNREVTSAGSVFRASSPPDIKKERTALQRFMPKLLLLLIIALIIFVVYRLIPSCNAPSLPTSVTEGVSDVSESDFAEDEVFSVDKIEGNVLGTGFAMSNLDLYAEPDESSDVLASVTADDMLLVYGFEDGYYYVCTLEPQIFGYVPMELVDTGGIDLSNPDAPSQIVDEESGEITTESTTTTESEPTTSTSQREASSTSTTKSTTKSSTKSTSAASSTLSPEDFPTNSSPYFILVEKGSHTITIYSKDENGKYTRELRTYLTATGRTASLTPTGLFKVGAKEKWHCWGTTYSPYCTRYYGGLFFHGPIYKKKNFGTLYENSVSAIGTNASSGCMRTSCQAAYFIYRFCPTGTYVKIVSGSPLNHSASRPSISSQYVDPATGAVPVAGVTLSPGAVSLKIGETKTLTASVSPDSASEKGCRWLSGDTSVATVNTKGVVTAKGVGTCTITVTTVDGEYTAVCTVTVTDPNATTASTTVTSTTATVSESTTSQSSSQSTETTSSESETTASSTAQSTSTDTSVTSSSTETSAATEATTATTAASVTTAETTAATASTTTTSAATEESNA